MRKKKKSMKVHLVDILFLNTYKHYIKTCILFKCTCITYLEIFIRYRADQGKFLYGVGCQKLITQCSKKLIMNIYQKFLFFILYIADIIFNYIDVKWFAPKGSITYNFKKNEVGK